MDLILSLYPHHSSFRSFKIIQNLSFLSLDGFTIEVSTNRCTSLDPANKQTSYHDTVPLNVYSHDREKNTQRYKLDSTLHQSPRSQSPETGKLCKHAVHIPVETIKRTYLYKRIEPSRFKI